MMKYQLFFLLAFFVSLSAISQTSQLDNYRWTAIDARGEVSGRHENAFVAYKDKFYLIGGRGIKPVNVFDPATNTWEAKSEVPFQIHHFQALVYKDAIYIVGGMTGGYPKETPLENIWLYYPEKDTWEKGAEIPESRRRGGAGVALYEDKIYMAGGIKFGHTSGTTHYFDSYNLKTGEWEMLTDAPHIRDHFPALVVDDKLYCIGGRNTSVHYPDHFGAFFSATIPAVDYFDFKDNKWYTMRNELPVPTAAGGIVNIGEYIIYMGGEGKQGQAYNQTQCLNVNTAEWTQLAPMSTGRHGSAAILYEDNIYVAAGSPNKGGGNLGTIEVFSANHNWEKLFNGENLDAWSVKCKDKDKDKSYWSVDNGAILCNSMGNNKENEYVWLQYDKEYADFELRLKFKVANEHRGNTGVQIRSRYDEKAVVLGDPNEPGWLDGPQVDIEPGNPWRNGLIYDETRTEMRWIYPSLPDWKINKEEHASHRVIYYKEHEEPGWNDLTIVCKGTKITSIVNNLPVAEFDGKGILDNQDHQKLGVGMKGYIALQLHQKSENKIWFKNIELREL